MADVTRQVTNEQSSIRSRSEPKPIRLSPKNLIYYTVFLLVFCFSGIITMLDIVPYRMAAVSLLVIPLFLYYKFQIDRVFFAFLLLIFLIIISGLINGIQIVQQSLFIASVILSYLIYYLVKTYITRENAATVIRLCVVIGMIQLPAILIQLLTYNYLPASLKIRVSQTDFDFGTFNFRTDPAMTLFLVLLIIFLLFDEQRNYVVKRKWLVIAWFSLSVLIANSEIMKLVLVMVWAVYLLRHFKLANFIRFGSLFLLIALILLSMGLFNEIISDSIMKVQQVFALEERQKERFLSGGYGRGAAFSYYLNSDLKLLGDGPGKYYNLINRERTLGNTGHMLSYYAEIGLLGWLASALIFFLIAFQGRGTSFRVSMVGLLIFISIQLLSITTFIMNNISIIMIYSIVSLSYLVPKRSEIGKHHVIESDRNVLQSKAIN